MKKLRDFPLTQRAFKMILDDQPYPPHMKVRILDDARVPAKWLQWFEACEAGLTKAKGSVASAKLSAALLREVTDEGRQNARTIQMFECIVLPVNDTCLPLCAAVGMTKREAQAVDDVTSEFFDGELRQVFQTEPVHRLHDRERHATRH